MSTRYITGAIGAVVGYFIGGPSGAIQGWTIGSAVGQIIDPGTIQGPRVGDLAQQTSQEGGPRPIVFATSPPMTGNIICSGTPVKVKRKKKQGKGSPSVTYEVVLRTYAIGVCEGPITKFIRVWRNAELVYDGTPVSRFNFQHPDLKLILEMVLRIDKNNQVFTDRARFYLGGYDQNPDNALEEIFGVGKTPSHRGTAYMVVENDDLTDMRGAIPQYLFQVTKEIDGVEQVVFFEDGVWVKPPQLVSARVTVIGDGGGGAGGGGGPSDARYGGGGAGGSYVSGDIDADDLDDTIDVTVGQGGDGGAPVNSSPGGTGGNFGEDATGSEFGLLLASPGGHGGIPFTGSGPGAATCDAPTWDVAKVSNVVHETGGTATKESAFPQANTVHAGAGGGQATTSAGTGQPGGDATHSSSDFSGGDGGRGGIGQNGADGLPGHDGGDYGGGGGGGGAAGEGAGHFPSGRGGHGAPGVVVVDQFFDEPRTDLKDVVIEICARANLDEDKIDVSRLVGQVFGYSVINAYPATEALRALSQIYLFDVTSIDGKIVFIPRGADTVATIVEGDLLDDHEIDIEASTRADSMTIPRVMNLTYFDIMGGMAPDKQTSERAGDRRAVGEMQIQSPVVMTADMAAKAVAINHKTLIEDQKGTVKLSLADNFIGISPIDNIFLDVDGRVERLRVSQIAMQEGFQEYTLTRDRQSAYTSNIEGYPAASQTLPDSNFPGPSLLEILDIHILHDVDDSGGLIYYVAVSGTSDAWRGATVELSYDGGANYVSSQDAQLPIVMGYLTTALDDHPQAYPDVTHTFRVQIDVLNVDIADTDLAGMFSGVNLAIVGDELIQFADANEISQGLWEFSYLLRGRKGSATAHHAIGSRFVILESLTGIPASVTDIGRTMTFRATSYGMPVDTATIRSIVYAGRCQIEREVAYLEARRDGVNAIVTWQGVGRLGAGGSVAQGARFEGYRITLDDGVNAAVTVDTGAQSYTRDVSGLSSPITISVVQLNGLTGAGPSTEVILE